MNDYFIQGISDRYKYITVQEICVENQSEHFRCMPECWHDQSGLVSHSQTLAGEGWLHKRKSAPAVGYVCTHHHVNHIVRGYYQSLLFFDGYSLNN